MAYRDRHGNLQATEAYTSDPSGLGATFPFDWSRKNPLVKVLMLALAVSLGIIAFAVFH